jgi:hypothetical protein
VIGAAAGVFYLVILYATVVRSAAVYRCRLFCSSVLVSFEIGMNVFVICLTVYNPYVTAKLPMTAATVELAGTVLTDYSCAKILYLGINDFGPTIPDARANRVARARDCDRLFVYIFFLWLDAFWCLAFAVIVLLSSSCVLLQSTVVILSLCVGLLFSFPTMCCTWLEEGSIGSYEHLKFVKVICIGIFMKSIPEIVFFSVGDLFLMMGVTDLVVRLGQWMLSRCKKDDSDEEAPRS